MRKLSIVSSHTGVNFKKLPHTHTHTHTHTSLKEHAFVTVTKRVDKRTFVYYQADMK